MTKRRDWWKVRRGWYETHSHIDLSFDAINLGPLLMGMADESEWWASGVGVVCPTLTREQTLRRIVRASHAESVDRVEAALAELVDCGTLQVVDDKWVFPTYRIHQEDPRTTRRRKKSEQVSRTMSGTMSGTTPEHLPGEAEAEAEAEAELNPPTPRKRGKATSVMASVEDTEQVCVWIAQARQRAGIGKARPPAVTEQTRREVRKPMAKCGATLEDWSTVINRQVAACRGDIDSARKYLTLSTLHRPGNFTRLLERDDLDGHSQPGGDW